MKKICAIAGLAFMIGCGPDQGENRPENMNTVEQETPSSDPNPTQQNGGMDTSHNMRTQDSSTVIDYDTAAKKKQ
jgi:hypothetical protein